MSEEKHRIVVDTNLWISFLLTRDFSKLDRLLSTGRTILLISQELLEEIVEVAERPKFKKYFDLFELTELLVNLKQKAEFVQVRSHVNVCRDEKDNFLLSLAIDGSATHVLTGDKDLLVLHPFGEIEILTIADYLSDK
ncbi:putative toxin-antitoxin system toxin component, PIN family [Flavisolibacter ginsenosidimutans]|uniref:Putative toxin-antitoxin system toxin component, PIN family n=1 Tax=Flavisolibacter ginsenosidimutans TaxID=661481 RepID=A0A5B8UEP4_9BACT|nr:putative toxin-antitoxin system toxin component, PIN family [Flavisolibacter ginsenosidimutans]QEC54835.1 putative toxin-antitoxin system toxin component, PIN family [Flavisolibacter ginsenosidimutans]